MLSLTCLIVLIRGCCVLGFCCVWIIVYIRFGVCALVFLLRGLGC